MSNMPLLESWNALAGHLMTRSSLSPRHRELVHQARGRSDGESQKLQPSKRAFVAPVPQNPEERLRSAAVLASSRQVPVSGWPSLL